MIDRDISVVVVVSPVNGFFRFSNPKTLQVGLHYSNTIIIYYGLFFTVFWL